jgi:hypothetical protein
MKLRLVSFTQRFPSWIVVLAQRHAASNVWNVAATTCPAMLADTAV